MYTRFAGLNRQDGLMNTVSEGNSFVNVVGGELQYPVRQLAPTLQALPKVHKKGIPI